MPKVNHYLAQSSVYVGMASTHVNVNSNVARLVFTV